MIGLAVWLPSPPWRRGSSPQRLISPAPPTRLWLVSGAVTVSGRRPVAGQQLSAGESLLVGSGRAVLAFGDGSAAVLESDTHLRLVTLRRSSIQVRLIRGRVTFEVHPTPRRPRFTVHTPAGRLTVLGTVFRVGCDSRRLQLDVARGRVQLGRDADAAVVVAKGETLDLKRGKRALDPQQQRRLLRDAAFAQRLIREVGVVLSVDTLPPDALVRLDGRRIGRTPLSVQVRPGRPLASLSLAGYVTHTQRLVVPVGGKTSLRRRLEPRLSGVDPLGYGPMVVVGPSPVPIQSRAAPMDSGRRSTDPPDPAAGSVRAAPPGREAPAKPTVAQLLTQVRQLRLQQNWTGVVAVYSRIIRLYPSASVARTCLVLMGQVRLRILKQPRAALRAFNRYLQGSGRGSLAQEAAWGRLQALRRLGLPQREIRAARAFLKRFPTGIYSQRVAQQLRQLSRPKP